MTEHTSQHTPRQQATERHPPEAYQFVREGLDYTVDAVHANADMAPESRHITGQQLCLGLRDYAIRQYGRLARPVLAKWGIRRTEDFGHIVYHMIETGLLSKTADDSPEDFENVFDFAEAFGDVRVL